MTPHSSTSTAPLSTSTSRKVPRPDPENLNSIAAGWPTVNDGVVTTHRYDNLQWDYSICVTSDSNGDIYLGGRGPLENLTKTGFRIEKLDPTGNVLWTAVGPEAYECTEVFVREEEGTEYLYAMGFHVYTSVASAGPIILVKLNVETGAEVGTVSLNAPATVSGGNFETMAVGSDGVKQGRGRAAVAG